MSRRPTPGRGSEIGHTTELRELAALVSETLAASGIVATLSGGAAIGLYTEGSYRSEDLDYVTAALVDELAEALAPLGFIHKGTPRLSVFEHPKARWYLEFPPSPLMFGGTFVEPEDCSTIETPAGSLRIITPTHCVMDRLVRAASWSDAEALQQALLVAQHRRRDLDWQQLDEFVETEGIESAPEIQAFYRARDRTPPFGNERGST